MRCSKIKYSFTRQAVGTQKADISGLWVQIQAANRGAGFVTKFIAHGLINTLVMQGTAYIYNYSIYRLRSTYVDRPGGSRFAPEHSVKVSITFYFRRPSPIYYVLDRFAT